MRLGKIIVLLAAAVFAAACASAPKTYTQKTVYLENHMYPDAYVSNFRISDKDVKKLDKAGVRPLFEISQKDLKELYPDYAPRADAPLIGILFNREGKDYAIPATYVYAVAKTGARIRILSFDGVERQAQDLDGILLTGGDFDWPKEFYVNLQNKKYPKTGKRYAAYVFLTRYAVERGLPALGICAGLQEMGTTLGKGKVKLYEDLSFVTVRHHRNVPGTQTAHTVTAVPGSRLERIVGLGEMNVNSRHFQAIVPSSLLESEDVKAAAWSPDGVVEALEFPAYPHFLAVQFHPEVFAWQGDERSQKIFDAFVQDAAAYKRVK